jgi:hypothetical protein
MKIKSIHYFAGSNQKTFENGPKDPRPGTSTSSDLPSPAEPRAREMLEKARKLFDEQYRSLSSGPSRAVPSQHMMECALKGNVPAAEVPHSPIASPIPVHAAQPRTSHVIPPEPAFSELRQGNSSVLGSAFSSLERSGTYTEEHQVKRRRFPAPLGSELAGHSAPTGVHRPSHRGDHLAPVPLATVPANLTIAQRRSAGSYLSDDAKQSLVAVSLTDLTHFIAHNLNNSQ